MLEDDYLHMGDVVCLYCEESSGYVFCDQTSLIGKGVYTFTNQDKIKTYGIGNVQAVQFRIVTQNRYKLNKQYRKLVKTHGLDPDAQATKDVIAKAKKAADVERGDNESEQSRLHGKILYYGDIVQLWNIFTDKYVHTNIAETSKVEKCMVKMSMEEYNARNAQFILRPRFKLKTEGEKIESGDHVMLESLKSPGLFWKASAVHRISDEITGSELYLSGEPGTFSVIKHHHPSTGIEEYLRSGSVVRLYHKSMEAYLAAEGVFGRPLEQKVHMRIRAVQTSVLRTCYPPVSGIYYWQLESEKSVLRGKPLRWEEKVHLRHMPSRQYLCLADSEFYMNESSQDPNSVFRFIPLTRRPESVFVKESQNVQIQHVLTGRFLHCSEDEEYVRIIGSESNGTLDGLCWTNAPTRQLQFKDKFNYSDSFSIQAVQKINVKNFNFVAGMIPFIRNFTADRKNGVLLTKQHANKLVESLEDLKNFVVIHGVANKKYQKLLRNLMVVDELVVLLKTGCSSGLPDWPQLSYVFSAVYDVLYAYTKGDSRKNELYFAKHYFFFQQQLALQGTIGEKCCNMLVDMVQDNKRIVDRIPPSNDLIHTLRQTKRANILELLTAFCVCENIAQPKYQTIIATSLLCSNKDVIYRLQVGQNINKQFGVVYISRDAGISWKGLHKFMLKSDPYYDENEAKYLIQQLSLFKALCHGHNAEAIRLITTDADVLSWDVALAVLQSDVVTDDVRTMFCEFIGFVFIDLSGCNSITEHITNNFVQWELDSAAKNGRTTENKVHSEKAAHVYDFKPLTEWIFTFLKENRYLVATIPLRNMLIKQVIELVGHLVEYGFLLPDDEAVRVSIRNIFGYLDKGSDVRYAPDKGKGFSSAMEVLNKQYQRKDRFKKDKLTDSVIAVKLQVLDFLQMLMKRDLYNATRSFIIFFQDIRRQEKKKFGILDRLWARRLLGKKFINMLNTEWQAESAWEGTKASIFSMVEKFMKKLQRENTMVFFDPHLIAQDLFQYESLELLHKVLALLNKHYSFAEDLFEKLDTAQVILNDHSELVHNESLKAVSELRKIVTRKLENRSLQQMSNLFTTCTTLLNNGTIETSPNLVYQMIIYNNGMLNIILQFLGDNNTIELLNEYEELGATITSAYGLIENLVHGNSVIQEWVMDHFDILCETQICGKAVAKMLRKTFMANERHCNLLAPEQIGKIFELLLNFKADAGQFFDVLQEIVINVDTGMIHHRNCQIVAKYLTENFKKVAFVLDVTEAERLTYLEAIGQCEDRDYLVSLIKLITSCSAIGNKHMQSVCYAALTVDEILNILNSKLVPINVKIAFGNFLIHVYFFASKSGTERRYLDDIAHNRAMWFHLRALARLMHQMLIVLIPDSSRPTSDAAISTLDVTLSFDGISFSDLSSYLLQCGFSLLHLFFSQVFQPDFVRYPVEEVIIKKLTGALVPFCQYVLASGISERELQTMQQCLDTLISKTVVDFSSKTVDRFYSTTETGNKIMIMKDTVINKKNLRMNDTDEVILNMTLRRFALHFQSFLQGPNTLAAQLDVSDSKIKHEEYNPADQKIPLPLGATFQLHVKTFINKREQQVEQEHWMALKLIDYLLYSASKYRERAPVEQHRLDLKIMRILRAMIYNNVVLLPRNWSDTPRKYVVMLDRIKRIQNLMINHNVIKKMMPMMARDDQLFGREALALCNVLLFNANSTAQMSMLHYFKTAVDEVFFVFVRREMQLARLSFKTKNLEIASSKSGVMVDEPVEEDKPKKKARTSGHDVASFNMGFQTGDEIELLTQNKADDGAGMENFFQLGEMENSELVDKPKSDSNSSIVDLVLQILASLCDGQNTNMQTYFRVQPDNLKSINLVQELASYISVLSSQVNSKTITALTQLYSTLTEISLGNKQNQEVIVNCKVIDYTNFVLRLDNYADCSADQIIQLWSKIATMLAALIEENGPIASIIATDVCDTLDLFAVYRILVACYFVHKKKGNPSIILHLDKLELMMQEKQTMSSRVSKMLTKSALKQDLKNVGFQLYLILARLTDIKKSIEKTLFVERSQKAFNYYKKHCASVEIMKNGNLQRRHFRIKNKDLLREEVKEHIKWNIDRSSPTIKLRELVYWSRDILDDITYQKTMLKNPIMAQLAKRWSIWNYLQILLSLIINVMMLVTWEPIYSSSDIPADSDNYTLDPLIYNPQYISTWNGYEQAVTVLGPMHNVCSFMLLFTYLLLNHPRLPDHMAVIDALNNALDWIGGQNGDSEEEGSALKPGDQLHPGEPQMPATDPSKAHSTVQHTDNETQVKKKRKSRLEVKLFSLVTFYYVGLFGLSLWGTFQGGYLFSVHLLNIVANNEMLKQVVRAVTQNGLSLIWVSIMGIIIIYLYGLLIFAFFRYAVIPADGYQVFCRTLYECVITVLRYGMVGDLSGHLALSSYDQEDFFHFGLLTLIQCSFFVIFTTVGLNVILGIIVDTFSQLRDLKWSAAEDMRTSCFICGREAFIFEHSGLGFRHHVLNDHNMWNYIFYFMYLDETQPTDYSSVDLYVYNLLSKEKLDFFPINEAICLLHVKENDAEDMIQVVITKLDDMKKKQDILERRMRLKANRAKQMLWVNNVKQLRDVSPAAEPAVIEHEPARRRDSLNSFESLSLH